MEAFDAQREESIQYHKNSIAYIEQQLNWKTQLGPDYKCIDFAKPPGEFGKQILGQNVTGYVYCIGSRAGNPKEIHDKNAQIRAAPNKNPLNLNFKYVDWIDDQSAVKAQTTDYGERMVAMWMEAKPTARVLKHRIIS